jgi:hypothetical protein
LNNEKPQVMDDYLARDRVRIPSIGGRNRPKLLVRAENRDLDVSTVMCEHFFFDQLVTIIPE